MHATCVLKRTRSRIVLPQASQCQRTRLCPVCTLPAHKVVALEAAHGSAYHTFPAKKCVGATHSGSLLHMRPIVDGGRDVRPVCNVVGPPDVDFMANADIRHLKGRVGVVQNAMHPSGGHLIA